MLKQKNLIKVIEMSDIMRDFSHIVHRYDKDKKVKRLKKKQVCK